MTSLKQYGIIPILTEIGVQDLDYDINHCGAYSKHDKIKSCTEEYLDMLKLEEVFTSEC